MRFLVTGRGGSGSWAIRGEQLGAALGAVVKPHATLADCRQADAIIAVKRIPPGVLTAIRASGKPWLFDAVDCWPQPAGNAWNQRQAVGWMRRYIEVLNPTAVIYATERMAEDVGFPGRHIYHHARPEITINPVREVAAVIGYEGREAYLGHWRQAIEAECVRRGMRFVINPARLADCDIVIALRGGPWDGYAPRHWKSNVKLANAQASGTPVILAPECGYTETLSGGEYFVRSVGDLTIAFDWLSPQENRAEASVRLLRKTYTVARAAEDIGCAARSLLALG